MLIQDNGNAHHKIFPLRNFTFLREHKEHMHSDKKNESEKSDEIRSNGFGDKPEKIFCKRRPNILISEALGSSFILERLKVGMSCVKGMIYIIWGCNSY